MFRTAARGAFLSSGTVSATHRVFIPAFASIRDSRFVCSYSTTSHLSNMSMTVTEAITHDHRELEDYYNNIKKAPDHDTATRWQNQFVWELARHSIGEELVVYPAFEKYLGDKGKDMANQDRADHNQLKVELKKFQNLKSTDPDFAPTLDKLFKDLQDHVKSEEAVDLPTLEKALTDDVTADIAKTFERTKMFTPTRSHPSAPDKPPFETVAGLLAAPLDKLSDLFRKFPTESTPRVG
ncbi:hypothetical protein EV426DRAFT_607122 [Tirmania nivea]|nr:hypothetical protein EV426DRAFT_607122 [Tirmania nivea]